MTKQDFTAITVIADASGSMSHLQLDTIGSINSFLKTQKEFPGEAVFTFVTFNNLSHTVADFVKLASAENVSTSTYRPSGGTALLDAMGDAITSVGQRLASLPEEERPSKVLFLIITDGQENSSHRYTQEQIKSMVEHQRQVYSWEFVFIGANIDAFAAGTSLGISGTNSVSYQATSAGTARLYDTISESTKSYRSSHSSLAPDFFNQPSTPTTPVTPATPPATPVTPKK